MNPGAKVARLQRSCRWADVGRRTVMTARSGADRRVCSASCVLRGSPYASSSLPPMDVEGVRQGTSKGLDPHDSAPSRSPLICAVAALAAAGCGESAGSGGDADPATLVPATRRLRRGRRPADGERRDDALAAAGKLLRTDDPAGKLRAAHRRGARRGRRRVRRGRRTSSRGWARTRASGRRNLEATEPSWAVIVATKDVGAAEAALGRFRDDEPDATLHEPLLQRRRLRGRLRAGRDRRDRRLRGDRDRGRVQAHRRLRDEGRAWPTPTATRTRSTTLDDEQPRPLLRRSAARCSRPRSSRTRPPPRSSSSSSRSSRSTSSAPITGAFQADGERLALDTVLTGVPEGPFRDLAKLWSGRQAGCSTDLPGDAWAAFGRSRARRGGWSRRSTRSPARSAARPSPAQVKQATGLDLDAGHLLAGSATSACFVRGDDEADARRRARDRGRRTTPGPRRRSASSSG